PLTTPLPLPAALPISAQNQTITFEIYIDPSGTVVSPEADPIAGATVTLLSSDSPEGPFAAVPDGSAVMSPANRHNPDTTGAGGTDRKSTRLNSSHVAI